MGFIGDIFSGDKGSGYQAGAAGLMGGISGPQIDALYNQAQGAYGQAQGGLDQQQAFVNALSAQNGIGNQSNVFNQQQALANTFSDQAAGRGPNPAQLMLSQATGQNVANQAALMGSNRNASANTGLIGRQAAMQGANIQQNAAGQAAILQAQQQLAAQQNLQKQQGLMSGLASQQVAQQQGAIAGYNQIAQGNTALAQHQYGQAQDALAKQNAASVAMQSNINNANAGIANTNAQGQQQILGGLFNGASSAFGSIPGMNQGGAVRGYADGGPIVPDGSNIEDLGPKSFAGKFLQGLMDPMGERADSGKSVLQTGSENLGAGIVKGMQGLFSSPSTPQTDANFQMPTMGSQFSGVTAALKSGGKVPGQASVRGDSVQNDKVAAMLSPGEVVIPRSVMQSRDPAKAAQQFVAAILAKNTMRKKS